MRVFRIEDSDGVGCFVSSLVCEATYKVTDEGFLLEPSPQRHPCPDQDEQLRPHFKRGIHSFGFDSIPQLLRWFDSERIRQAMNTLGGKLVTYEVPSKFVIVSDYQTIFEKDKAQVVSIEPIPTLA